MNEKNFPKPPEHLSVKSQELYNFYIRKSVRAPGQIAFFVRGLEAMDIADECTRIIRLEGLTVKSERSKMTRQHPLLNTRKEAIGEMIKIFKILKLESNFYRTPGGIGYQDFV